MKNPNWVSYNGLLSLNIRQAINSGDVSKYSNVLIDKARGVERINNERKKQDTNTIPDMNKKTKAVVVPSDTIRMSVQNVEQQNRLAMV